MAIVVWSLVSGPPEMGAFAGADKVLHGLGYMISTLLFLLAGVWRPGRAGLPRPGSILRVGLIAVMAGGALEVGQGLLMEDREPEAMDVVFEVLGVAAAIGALGILRSWVGAGKPLRGTG